MNLKVRFRNPVFIAQLFLSVLMPVLTYSGLTVQDITTWQTLGNLLYNALGNPYVLGLIAVSVWNAFVWGDSESLCFGNCYHQRLERLD